MENFKGIILVFYEEMWQSFDKFQTHADTSSY